MNGYTLRHYVLADALNRDISLGVWLAQQHTLSIALSVFTVLFELLFFVSLIWPRTAPFIFINALLFHVGLYVAGGHGFFQHMVLLILLLVFIQPDWWRGWVNRYFGGLLWRWRTEEQPARS